MFLGDYNEINKRNIERIVNEVLREDSRILLRILGLKEKSNSNMIASLMPEGKTERYLITDELMISV